MDMPAVIGVLNDLPDTFRWNGAPYTQFIDAIGAAKALFTQGADATIGQVQSFNVPPLDGWLDTWGLLFGLPRVPGESNASYQARVSDTILAWVGTVPAIQVWINLFAQGGYVTENPPGTLGYSVVLPSSMNNTQIRQFLVSLNRIRPIGVPFTLFQIAGGLILNTDAFFDIGSRTAGDYLSANLIPLNALLNAVQLSAKLLLPSYLMSDPVLNPGLTS